MARVKGIVVGLPTGKCGDIVYKIRYGQSFMYKACQDFHKSESDASKAIRERMKVMSEFGSIVRSVPELYLIWKEADVKAKAAYHKIQKLNAKLFERNRPTTINKIVPDHGFESPVSAIEFTSSGISIKTEMDKYEEIDKLIRKFVAVNVVCVYEPVNPEMKYFQMFAVRKDLGLCLTKVVLEIDFLFEEEIKQLVAGYKKGIVYFEIIPVDELGKPLSFSDYYAHEFELGEVEEEKENVLESVK